MIPLRSYPVPSGGTGRVIIAAGSVIDFVGDGHRAAIVNAANERGLGGGGVDGAMNRAGGDRLISARRALPVLDNYGTRIPTGSARATDAGDLPVDIVVHAVGPAYFCDEDEYPAMDSKLACAYKRSVKLARKHGIQKLGFSLLSAGVFSGQRGLKAILGIAFNAVIETAGDIDVFLVAFQDREQRLLVSVGDRYATAHSESSGPADAAEKHTAAAVEDGRTAALTAAPKATTDTAKADTAKAGEAVVTAALSAGKDSAMAPMLEAVAPAATDEIPAAEAAARGVGDAETKPSPWARVAKRVTTAGEDEQSGSKRAKVEGVATT